MDPYELLKGLIDRLEDVVSHPEVLRHGVLNRTKGKRRQQVQVCPGIAISLKGLKSFHPA